MKSLLTTVLAMLLLVALSSAAWAGGRGRCRHEPHPRVEAGPDLDGDGRVTTYERIRYERQQRFERLHGS